MKIKYFSALLITLFCGTVYCSTNSNRIQGAAVLATVNAEAITLGDVLSESYNSEAIAQAYAGNDLRKEIAKLRREAVDRIIDRKLLVGEFKRLNLDLPQQYVENMLDDFALNMNCKNRTELAAKARLMGTSITELREKCAERIMAEIVIGRLLYAAHTPTPQELEEYFAANEKTFSVSEQIELALLQLPKDANTATIDEIKNKLDKDSKGFADMVKAFSCGPNRDKGGAVGMVERSNLREEFAAVMPADKIVAGKVYGPVKTAEGYYFIQVTTFKPGKKAVFEEHRDAIFEKLMQQSREKIISELKTDLRKQASITYYLDQPPTGMGTEKITVTTITATTKKAVKTEKKIMVTLKTNYGDIKLELFADAAPKTVENFLEYVKSGFYNGTLFHRVIDNFMIQGGGFDQKFKQKATRKPIQNEADNRLSNEIGTIAMARTMDPHSATAQFFINVANNDFLDFRSPTPQFYGYCVFGKVIEGMDVVNKIKGVKTGGRSGHQDVPIEDVVIIEAVID